MKHFMLVYSRVSVIKVYSLALKMFLYMLWEKFLLQKLVGVISLK